jgi:hypothetical protein
MGARESSPSTRATPEVRSVTRKGHQDGPSSTMTIGSGSARSRNAGGHTMKPSRTAQKLDQQFARRVAEDLAGEAVLRRKLSCASRTVDRSEFMSVTVDPTEAYVESVPARPVETGSTWSLRSGAVAH